MELRVERARELGLSSKDIEWFSHFSHPEKWDAECVLWDGAFWHEYGRESEARDVFMGLR